MRRLTDREYRTWRRGILAVLFLLLGFILAGCAGSLFGAGARPTPELASASLANSSSPTLEISPASGSGGVYVQVRGAHWPQNMLVLVTLKDTQGSSGTLASSNTDQTGNLATGFLYPIDERWLADGLRSVVVTTADGRVATKADFDVVPPGDAIAMADSTLAATKPAPVMEPGVLRRVASQRHIVSLPALFVHQPSAGTAGSNGATSSPSNAQEVTIEIAPGQKSRSVDCDNERATTVAILTTTDFDAMLVEPSTVSVAGRPSSIATDAQGSRAGSLVEPAERRPKDPKRNPRNRRGPLTDDDDDDDEGGDDGYQWRWYSEDVDRDGHADLVMKFRLGYIELTCDAVAVTLTGRTRDGRTFAGHSDVTMATRDEG